MTSIPESCLYINVLKWGQTTGAGGWVVYPLPVPYLRRPWSQLNWCWCWCWCCCWQHYAAHWGQKIATSTHTHTQTRARVRACYHLTSTNSTLNELFILIFKGRPRPPPQVRIAARFLASKRLRLSLESLCWQQRNVVLRKYEAKVL